LGSTLVAFGEALWDLLPTGAVLGGAPLNFAYRANFLGHESYIVSRLGDDDLGRKARTRICELGINDACLQQDRHHPTGTVEIYFDDDKNPDYIIIENVAYDYIEPGSRLTQTVEDADCFCFGTLAQRNSISRQTLQELISIFSGKFALLDINLRKNCYSYETIKSSLERANTVKLNDEELAQLAVILGLQGKTAPDRVEDLLKRSELLYAVVTLGERGAFAVSQKGERVYSPGYLIKLVDPCGAGDGFAAAFIHALLDGQSLTRACRLGNALGAMVAQQEGATRPVSYDELTAFMKTNQPDIIDDEFSIYIG
jgi:fructokinase